MKRVRNSRPKLSRNYPIEHPRCGTAFLLTVVLVSVFVFSLVRLLQLPFLLIVLSRIIFIPVIAGIAYELLRFTARNVNNPIVRIIIKPNLALQHLTTRQPELHMIEVAIVSFKRVLVSEGLLALRMLPFRNHALKQYRQRWRQRRKLHSSKHLILWVVCPIVGRFFSPTYHLPQCGAVQALSDYSLDSRRWYGYHPLELQCIRVFRGVLKAGGISFNFQNHCFP